MKFVHWISPEPLGLCTYHCFPLEDMLVILLPSFSAVSFSHLRASVTFFAWSDSIAQLPASMAQSDVCLTGDQEVTVSIPAWSGNILPWRLIMKYFLQSFSVSADSRRAVVSFWGKNVHK